MRVRQSCGVGYRPPYRVNWHELATTYCSRLTVGGRSKLALDFTHKNRLRGVMTLSEEERKELPRKLFALAGRRLAYGTGRAGEGEGWNGSAERMAELSGQLHEVGEDMGVIADAIAVIVQGGAQD